MSAVFTGIKKLLFRLLPSPAIHRLKKWYYPRVVAGFPDEGWPWTEGVRRLVRTGDAVVDAGANIGYVSSILSRMVGADGRVLSFEAFPPTAELLQHNVNGTGLSRVKVFSLGLSDREGTLEMHVPKYAWGGENFYESSFQQLSPDGSGMKVPVRTLDSVLREEGVEPSFVKIDVEGHELEVLKGCCWMLGEVKPSLLIEISGDPDAEGSRAAEVFALLAGFGYGPFVLTANGFAPRSSGTVQTDYFFLQPGIETAEGS